MRWWLALAFAAIASLTALAVAQVFTSRAEDAFRSRARELATGNAVAAATEVTRAPTAAELRRSVAQQSERRRVALFVFDRKGRPLTPARSRATTWEGVPFRNEALGQALAGRRFVDTVDGGRVIVVALPLRGDVGAGLVAVAFRPDLVAELGIVRDELVRAALIAVAAGAAVGLLIALLIAARLRRIATVAARIEQGSFDSELRPWFWDELGQLAATVDRMRGRLRDSFSNLQAERDRLRMLLEQLNEGVIAVNRELTIEFANAAARELLSGHVIAEGEPLPEPWPQLALRDLARRLFLEGAAVGQARVAPDEGRTFAIAGIPAGRGSQLAVLVVADISERERRERAEREFVANAAHELRTPIAAIGTALEALELGALDVPEDRDHFLAVVRRQSDRLGRLVRALLALARAQTRQEALRLEAVQLRPLLDEVAATLDSEPGVELAIDCGPDVCDSRPARPRRPGRGQPRDERREAHASGDDRARRACGQRRLGRARGSGHG